MIRILTDSTADLLPEDLHSLSVRVVPLEVHFGDEHYEDGVDLGHEQFYEMLEQAHKLVTFRNDKNLISKAKKILLSE